MSIKKRLKSNRTWYVVDSRKEDMNGWGLSSDHIFKTAHELHLKASYYTMQGCRIIGVLASTDEITHFMRVLGNNAYLCWKADRFQADAFR